MVGVELLEFIQGQNRGPTEKISEAPGAYGSCSGSYTAGAASYETASALASWRSSKVGVAAQHSPGPNYTGLPPNLHPLVKPCVSSGRSAPGAGALLLWYTWMPPPPAGVPRTKGKQSQLQWHINCLELLAVHLALNHLKGCLRGKHVLVRMDNTATVAYIKRQGSLRPMNCHELRSRENGDSIPRWSS